MRHPDMQPDEFEDSPLPLVISLPDKLNWRIWKGTEVEVEQLSYDLPLDLFPYQHNSRWGGDDASLQQRPLGARNVGAVPIPRGPYWFCGDSDATVTIKPGWDERNRFTNKRRVSTTVSTQMKGIPVGIVRSRFLVRSLVICICLCTYHT